MSKAAIDNPERNKVQPGVIARRVASWRYSIRGRLTLLNLALLGILFVMLVLAQYFLLENYLMDDLATSLRTGARPTIERFMISPDGREGQLSRIGPRIAFEVLSRDTLGVVIDQKGEILKPSSSAAIAPPRGPNPGASQNATPDTNNSPPPTATPASSTTITSATGTTLYDNPAQAEKILNQLAAPPADLLARAESGETGLSYNTTLANWGKVLVVLMPIRQNIAPAQPSGRYEAGENVVGVLLLAGSRAANERALSDLLLINLVAFVVLIVIITLVSPLLARGSLTPLRRMIKTTQEIARGDLSRRVQLSTGEDELGQLSQSFNQMVEQLEGLFQAQRQLVADASHELRTPLTAIKGSLEVLMMGGTSANPAAANGLLKSMHQETLRLSRLVNDLLTLNKLDQGEMAIQLKPLRLAPFLAEVKATAQMLIQQSGKDLGLTVVNEANPNGEEAEVLASADHLKQVLYNLLDNAIKFSPNTGNIILKVIAPGTLKVTESNSKSEKNNNSPNTIFHPNRSQDYYQLVVEDHGEGITAEDLPRIFDRFYRGDASRSRQRGGGSGLGLTIVQALMKAQGGRVEVASTLEKGTTFTLYLQPALAGTLRSKPKADKGVVPSR